MKSKITIVDRYKEDGEEYLTVMLPNNEVFSNVHINDELIYEEKFQHGYSVQKLTYNCRHGEIYYTETYYFNCRSYR